MDYSEQTLTVEELAKALYENTSRESDQEQFDRDDVSWNDSDVRAYFRTKAHELFDRVLVGRA